MSSYKDNFSTLNTPTGRDGDLEAQRDAPPPPQATVGDAGMEYTIPTHTKLMALGGYFLLSLVLTLQSKMLLGKFAFPYLLTAMHTGMTAVGCYGLMLNGYIKPTRLGTRENVVLLAFSSLFTINIAISNVSLYVYICLPGMNRWLLTIQTGQWSQLLSTKSSDPPSRSSPFSFTDSTFPEPTQPRHIFP
jgi:hypothetical protein